MSRPITQPPLPTVVSPSGVVQVTEGVGTPLAVHTRRILSPVVMERILGVSQGPSGVMVIWGAAARRKVIDL